MIHRLLLFSVALILSSQLNILAQDYRLTKLIRNSYLYDSTKQNAEEFRNDTLLYTYIDGQVATLNGEAYVYKKNKVEYKGSDPKNKNLHEIEINKEGQVERRGSHKFKYHKNGKLKSFEGQPILSGTKEDVLYDELDRIRVIGTDLKYDRYLLLAYNDKNQCISIDGKTTIEWEGDKIKTIRGCGYGNGNNYYVVKHDFFYDEHGNIIEEKIYTPTKRDSKESYLAVHYKAEYEQGKGNDDQIIFEMRSPFVNIALGQKSFFSPYYVNY